MLRQEQRERGATEGMKWAQSAHPVELGRFVDHVGLIVDRYRSDPWKAIYEFPVLDVHKSEGKDYLRSFNNAVREIWRVRGRVCSMRRVHEGFPDGVRWTEEFSTPELLSRLEAVLREDVTSLPIGSGGKDYRRWVTPAHAIVVQLLGEEYPEDEDDSEYFAIDCDEFREFWKPFVTEPLDDFLAQAAKDNPGIITHKLADPHYIEGFIAGALSSLEECHR